ncbi:MAG: hypothetical protein ABS948_01110 [Solibacillus sp.]
MDEQSIRFFQQQLEWFKEQDLLLAKIEGKLRAMRDLAAYRLMYELEAADIELLNDQMQQLQREIVELERQRDIEVLH